MAVNRIKGGLGASKLKALAPLDIERFYADLAEAGSRVGKPLSAKSVRNTQVVLRKALSDAERLGLVPRNAAAAAKPPAVPTKEYQTWDSDQLVRFFEHVARELVDSIEIDPAFAWGGWLDSAYIDAQQARSLSAVGGHGVLVDLFDQALRQVPDSYPRDRGVYLARAAIAQARAGDCDRAAQLGGEALEAGQVMQSGRIDAELRSLLEEFGGIETDSVSGFHELAHSANLA